jgi:hypothetical protein
VKDKNQKYQFLFSMDEYNSFREKYDPEGKKYLYDYKKGLGTLTEEEWHALFEKYKIEDLLQPLHLKNSEASEEELRELTSWLADDSQFRKDKILNKITEFDINKI